MWQQKQKISTPEEKGPEPRDKGKPQKLESQGTFPWHLQKKQPCQPFDFSLDDSFWTSRTVGE